MKKLEFDQMEKIEGGLWGSLICKVGFGVAGALMGGPIGAAAGATIGNILCMPLTATHLESNPDLKPLEGTVF